LADELSLSNEREAVCAGADALKHALGAFTAALLADEDLPARFESGLQGADARRKAADLYSDPLFPLDEEKEALELDENERTLKGRGVIGVSPHTVELANQLNVAKDAFRETVGKLYGRVLVKSEPKRSAARRESNGNKEPLKFEYEPVELFRYLLNVTQGNRFSWRQAIRKIVVLNRPPKLIAYTYHTSRSVQRLTLAEARAMAAATGKYDDSQSALGLLSGLDPNTPLAIVTQGAGLWMANVTRTDTEYQEILNEYERSTDITRKKPRPWHTLTTAIPVLVRMQAGDAFPLVRNIDLRPDDARKYKSRSDKKGLMPEPFISWLSLYRYNPEFERDERTNPKWIDRVDAALSRLNERRGSRRPLA
jgi:hypothetical protein